MPWEASLQGICILRGDQVLRRTFQTITGRWDCISSGRGATEISYSTCTCAQLQVIGAKPELVTNLNPWPVTISEALEMSFSLMGLLGLDNIYLPIAIARTVTQAISGKEGKSTELNLAN